MIIKNLTPHVITLISEEDTVFNPATRSYTTKEEYSIVCSIPSEGGIIPRCTQKEERIGEVEINGVILPVFSMVYGEVEGLPEEQEGIQYVVSARVAQACPDRCDLLIPTHMVRDEKGNIIGCTGFSRV